MTGDDLASWRRFFAEELQVVCNLRSPRLVEGFAAVRREAFLGPGPWMIRGDADSPGGGPRRTPSDDPRYLYDNVAVAIDPARQLFNGQPGTLAPWIDALGLEPGGRVLHLGCGLGYYAAVLAHCVGLTGRVLAVEVDAALAAAARGNLAPWPWVEVRHADGTDSLAEEFDAVLVNAGVTHPQVAWLDSLRVSGRLVLPLTFELGPACPTIGKGLTVLLTKRGTGEFDARVLGVVAVYSAAGIRDAAINDRLREALVRGGPPSIRRLRRDPHEPSASCWLHGGRF